MKNIIYIVLLIVFAVQWAVPLKMISYNERIINSGKAFKFKTQPIDPSDPLRGAYITLNYEISRYPTDRVDWVFGDRVYIVLAKDSLDFAKVAEVSKVKPSANTDFVVAECRNYYNGILNFELPFNRFYMNEKKAYDAELAYREAQRDSLPDNSYALVFVKDGNAVLADVLVNGASVTKIIPNKNK